MGRAVMPGPYLGDRAARRRGDRARPGRRRSGRNTCRASPRATLRATLAATEPNAALGRRRRSRWRRARQRGGFTLVRHQAVCPRRASCRHSRRGGAHPRRHHARRWGQPVPRAQDTAGARGRTAAVDRRDPQALRGAARQCRGAGDGAARRIARRLAGAGAGVRQALRWRCRPKCAAAAQRVLDMTVEYAKIARDLWQADRQLPGRQAQMRRHAGRDRERQVIDLLRRLGGRRGRGRGAAGGGDGEGLCLRRQPQGFATRASSCMAASA